MSGELVWQSLGDLARLLAHGATSSRDIVGAYLERIVALDDRVHAFVEVYPDRAREQAERADRERRSGAPRHPLHGLPIAIKDLLHIRGRVTSAGSKSRPHGMAEETASAAERLFATGMIALGKSHLVEFAFGTWGCNQPMGSPWNPWDTALHRVAGGSSSGSAVAVAAGLAPAAIGSDTGGSIRIPAALCGLTGFKPTYGLISLAGVFPLATSLDSLGPLTRSVDDAALLVAAMAGPDPRDPATHVRSPIDWMATIAAAPDIRGLQVTALAAEQFPHPAVPDVLAARAQTIATLRELGARVEEARLPFDLQDLMLRNGRIIAVEAYARHRAYIADPQLDIDPWVRQRILAGKAIGPDEYEAERAQRQRAVAAFALWMRGRDALLTPTVPIVASPVAEVDQSTSPLAAFTRAVNYFGACALSVPAGLSTEGLPIGMQLVGAPGADATLIGLGRAFQSITDWHRRRPDLSAWTASSAGRAHDDPA